ERRAAAGGAATAARAVGIGADVAAGRAAAPAAAAAVQADAGVLPEDRVPVAVHDAPTGHAAHPRGAVRDAPRLPRPAGAAQVVAVRVVRDPVRPAVAVERGSPDHRVRAVGAAGRAARAEGAVAVLRAAVAAEAAVRIVAAVIRADVRAGHAAGAEVRVVAAARALARVAALLAL